MNCWHSLAADAIYIDISIIDLLIQVHQTMLAESLMIIINNNITIVSITEATLS